ncbi:MAG: hypothetical protein IPP79_05395 [Chitinophagaceae bacterium]|nr:hypothetical protein [Chitinophagaceae bacterium]
MSSNTCNIQGTFTGTSTSSTGISAQMTYRLLDNNLAVGLAPITNASVTYGGYKNTCDSVYLSVFIL